MNTDNTDAGWVLSPVRVIRVHQR